MSDEKKIAKQVKDAHRQKERSGAVITGDIVGGDVVKKDKAPDDAKKEDA